RRGQRHAAPRSSDGSTLTRRRQRSTAPITGVTAASTVAPTSRNVTSTPRLDEFGFIPHLIARMRPRGIPRLYAVSPPARSDRLDHRVEQRVGCERAIGEYVSP